MFKKILHPTDFSETAYQALGYAIAMARRHEAELDLLHVLRMQDYSIVDIEEGQALLDEAYEGMGKALEKRAEEMIRDTDGGRAEADMIFRRGYSVDEEIVKEAEAKGADLIVMGTHSRAPVRKFFLGSVAEKVVHYAQCPVLVCGRSGHRQWRFDRILVPIDFSETSRRTAELALDLARTDGKTVRFLHVIEDKPQPSYLDEVKIPAAHPSTQEAAEKTLRELVESLDATGLEVSSKVAAGRPSRVITEEAEGDGYDLVAIGTTGLRGISRYLMGSTPARVLRSCSVPVLAVHGTS